MAMKKAVVASLLAVTVSIAIIGVAVPQEMGTGMMRGGMGSGMMERQSSQSSPRSNTAQGQMCSGSCPCMGDDMMHSGTMHEGMGGGMMGRHMHGGMGSDMAGSGAASGMGALFGSRVVPPMNLSVDDVRNFLRVRLDRLNNKRLKLGDLKSDDAVITADIVTVDNSLVQRLKVDRHTGGIEYEN